tara:strand:- start:637 stop:882 length:246 start_codon:yes stop_codon:yes gene_type:complete
MAKLNFLSHFSDVNLGATRDGVLSCHLSSDLTPDLCRSVVEQFPFDMSDYEVDFHTKGLVQYSAYALSNGQKDFFFWFTEK